MRTLKHTPRFRGQSTVEFAILMVALVPTFLYVLTSDDLLRSRLDLQEVVVASPWDYSQLNYETNKVPGNALEQNLRSGYADLNSSHASYSGDDTPNVPQTAPMTFTGWNEGITGGQDDRITCQQSDMASDLPNASILIQQLANAEKVNNGGLYSCRAALGVGNIRLTERFLQEWAGDNNPVSNKAQGGTGPGASRGVWRLSPQKFSVMAGTWALTESPNVAPGDKSGLLYDRVKPIYETLSGGPKQKADALAQKGEEINILQKSIITMDANILGDNTRTAEVAFVSSEKPQRDGFDASPWKSNGASGGGTYESAYKNRQKTYMGRTQAQWKTEW